MSTLKKQLFFGTDQSDENCHSHKIFITDNSVIISGVNENDPYYDFIEISFHEWEEIQQFIYEEKRDNQFLINFHKK
jgi:hypothetical protein